MYTVVFSGILARAVEDGGETMFSPEKCLQFYVMETCQVVLKSLASQLLPQYSSSSRLYATLRSLGSLSAICKRSGLVLVSG